MSSPGRVVTLIGMPDSAVRTSPVRRPLLSRNQAYKRASYIKLKRPNGRIRSRVSEVNTQSKLTTGRNRTIALISQMASPPNPPALTLFLQWHRLEASLAFGPESARAVAKTLETKFSRA
jgi:hypothetical protein